MRCPICYREMERYPLLGISLNNTFSYGYRCVRGHYRMEVRSGLIYARLLGNWFGLSGVDILDWLLYYLSLKLVTLYWLSQCGYRKVARRSDHASTSR